MYRQLVFSCIDKAVQETKKSSPKLMLAGLIAGILLVLNGLSIIFLGVGVKFRFADSVFCALLSLIAGVLCLVFAVVFFRDSVKSRSADANLRYREEYLKQVHAIGDEEVVFGLLDTLTPIACGKCELRFDQNIIACACEDDIDKNFVYPLSLLTRTGTGSIGSQPYLYMHFLINGKTVKKSVNMPQNQGQAIIRTLTNYNPRITVSQS